MVGSLPYSSIVSPQQPANGAPLYSLNACVQLLLPLCSTMICGQIDHMYRCRDLNNAGRIVMQRIL
jgi:hypothetical protein